jgi:hypothetical protein
MREAVLWTSRGRNVTEDDLTAMLEGREDLSEVQENPFAEMMKEDEAAENAQAPADGVQAPAENASCAEGAAPAVDTAAPVEASTTAENAAPATETPVEELAEAATEPVAETSAEDVPVEENLAETTEEWIATPTARDNLGSSSEQAQEDPQPTDVPATEPAAESQPSDNMTDEEFEAFMKKAQAFYDTQANESSEETDDSSSSEDSDDDDFPSIEVHSGD